MVETLRRSFSVIAAGVGRKDWSQNAEYKTEELIRSHQVRISWNYRYLIYGVPYGERYIGLLEPSTPQAGRPPWFFGDVLYNGVATYISECVLSTLTQNLVYVTVEEFDDYNQVFGPSIKTYGGAWGYGNVEIKFTKPIEWAVGKLMGIGMAVIDPTWPIVYYDISLTGIVDQVANIGYEGA